MPWTALSFTPSWLLLGALALLAGSLVVWFLVRIRKKKEWLPILAILERQKMRRPRFTPQTPPLLPLLCFLACALLVNLLFLRPKTTVYEPAKLAQGSVHLFLDYSPSVSAFVTLDQYQRWVSDIWGRLHSSKKVSVSSSHALTVFRPESEAELQNYLAGLTFHRAGLDLATALQKQLEQMEKTDLIVIFSDRNLHTWKRFNWQYLKDQSQILFSDMQQQNEGTRETAENVFFQKVHFNDSSPSSPVLEWDVEIARQFLPGDGNQAEESDGILEVQLHQNLLTSVPWHFKHGQTLHTVRVSWPAASMQVGAKDNEPLLWTLKPAKPDLIELDNTFRTPLKGYKPEILLVAEPRGEQELEDPAHQLKVALEVLGLRIRRYDWWSPQIPRNDVPLAIQFVGRQADIPAFCPLELNATGPDAPATHPQIWLVPYELDVQELRNICWCYDQLLHLSQNATEPPGYCRNMDSPRIFANTLHSLGGLALGGNVDKPETALAWRGRDPSGSLDVLAFLLPLHPSRLTGLTHAHLPLIVKDILTVQARIKTFMFGKDTEDRLDSNEEGWPRLADLAKEFAAEHQEPNSSLLLSNVPIGESSLQEAPRASFPPLWQPEHGLDLRLLAEQQSKQTPLPWLQLSLAALILLTVAEMLWLGRKRRLSSTITVVLLSFLFFPGRSEGEITLTVVGAAPPMRSNSFLSNQVSSRTSLSLARDFQIFAKLQNEAFEEPMLWVLSPAEISPMTELSSWIKRGGFLVIENARSLATLQEISAKLFADLSSANTNDPNEKPNWTVIPPDHEIMRSFYLLDSLPLCQPQELWYGFNFDRRLAILAIPFPFLNTLQGGPQQGETVSSAPATNETCPRPPSTEQASRIFINTLMVALATDYKKDQIHTKEILKRLQ